MEREFIGIFSCDNGYDCSCCRSEWLEYERELFDEDDSIEDIKNKFLCLNNDDRRYNRKKLSKLFEIAQEIRID